MSLPLETFSALIPREKSYNKDDSSGAHVLNDETAAKTPDLMNAVDLTKNAAVTAAGERHANTDDATTSVGVTTSDDQHVQKDYARTDVGVTANGDQHAEDGNATNYVGVTTTENQHPGGKNAAPMASAAENSRGFNPDFGSGSESDIVSEDGEVHVKQEDEAATEQHSSHGLAMLSALPAVVADSVMNPARAAMIAATATPQQTKEVRFVEGGGPQKSGMNSMPLGQRRPLGTSEPSHAVQPFAGGPQAVIGSQPGPGQPPYPPGPQYQFRGVLYNNAPPHFGGWSYYRPPPPSTHPMRTRSGKKRKAPNSQSVSISGASHTVLGQYNGFGNAGPALRSREEEAALKHAQQEIVWDELRGSVRTAIRKVYTTGTGRMKANELAQNALKQLHAIIVGNVGFSTTDEDSFDLDAPMSTDNAPPLAITDR